MKTLLLILLLVCFPLVGFAQTTSVPAQAIIVNKQTGTAYTVLNVDRARLVTFTNGSAIAAILPRFSNGWYVWVENRGVGTVTITPSSGTIDGAATLTLTTNQGVMLACDGTNYFTGARGKEVASGDVVGPGSSTDNAVTRFDGTTGKLIQNSAVTIDDSGSVVVPAGQSVQSPIFKSTASDPADAGVLRLGNNEFIEWEKATPGTDWTLGVNASDVLQTNAPFRALTITDDGLTSGRVTYAGTGGLLSDDSGFTYNSGTHALTATTFIGALTGVASGNTLLTVVPNTLPSSGQILVGNAGGTAYAPVSMSGDATLVSTGAITLASTISAGGPTGSATVAPIITYDAKGRLTTVSSATITPAVGSITGLGTNVSTWLATPSSANLRAALTDELGTGAALFDGATPTSFVLTNATGLPTTGLSGTLQAAQEPAHTGDVTNSAGSLALSIAANAVTLAKLATQATNTVLGNATSGTAVPTALPVGTCSTAGSALIWTTNTGFGCNTSITAAAAPVGGITGLGTGVGAALAINVGTAGSPVLNGGALGSPSSAGTLPAHTLGGTVSGGGNQINNVVIGTTTPLAGSFTAIVGTSETVTGTGTFSVWIGGPGRTQVSDDAGSSYIRQSIRPNSGKSGWLTYTEDSVADRWAVGVKNGDGALYITAGGIGGTDRLILGNAGTLTLTSGITNAAGTPGSICYNTSTFELTKNNALTCTVSHPKYKTEIVPLDSSGLDVVSKIQPMQFAYKDNPDRARWGFLSTQLQSVNSKLGDGYDVKGEAQSIDIPAILSIDTKAIQELKVKVERLENEKNNSIHHRYTVRRHRARAD